MAQIVLRPHLPHSQDSFYHDGVFAFVLMEQCWCRQAPRAVSSPTPSQVSAPKLESRRCHMCSVLHGAGWCGECQGRVSAPFIHNQCLVGQQISAAAH